MSIAAEILADNPIAYWKLDEENSSVNLITNPSFEVDTAGWISADPANASFTRSTAIAPTGIASLKFLGSGGVYIKVPIQTGQQYRAMAKLYSDSTNRTARIGFIHIPLPVFQSGPNRRYKWGINGPAILREDFSVNIITNPEFEVDTSTWSAADSVQGKVTRTLASLFGTASADVRKGAMTSIRALKTTSRAASIYATGSGPANIYATSHPASGVVQGQKRYDLVRNGPGRIHEEGTTNLISNPGFEAGTAPIVYSGCTAALDATTFYSGSNSAQFVADGIHLVPRIRTDAVLVNAGNIYTASARVKVPVGYDAHILVKDSTTDGTPGEIGTRGGATAPGTGDWQWISYTFTMAQPGTAATAPDSGIAGPAVFINVGFEVPGQAGIPPLGTTAWADCIQLEYKYYATTYCDGSLGSGYSWQASNNIIPNPSFETDFAGWEGMHKNLLTANQSDIETSAAGWLAVTGTIARTTSQSYRQVASLQLTAPGGGGDIRIHASPQGTSGQAVVPGSTYTINAFFKAGTLSRLCKVAPYFYTQAGANIGLACGYGPTVANNQFGWVQASYTFQVPDDAYLVDLDFVVVGAGASEVHYMDSASLMLDQGGNLINASNFENGTSGWISNNGATIAASPTQAYMGRTSLKCTTVSTTGFQGAANTTVVLGVGTYTYSAWVYNTTTVATGVVAVPGTATITGGTNVGSTVTTANVWTRSSVTFVVTVAGTISFTVQQNVASTTAGQIFYIDAAQMVRGSSAFTYYPHTSVNMVPNPSVEGGTALGWTSTSATSGTALTTGGYVNNNFYRVIADGTGQSGAYINAQTTLALIPTQNYSWSIYVRPAVTTLITPYIEWIAIPGGHISQVNGTSTSCPANVWTRLSVSGPAPATAIGANLIAYTTGTPTAGSQFDFDAAQFELGTQSTPYVDGTLTYVGGAWESSSNFIGNPSFDTNITGWSTADNGTAGSMTVTRDTSVTHSGAGSLKIVNTATGDDDYVWFSVSNLLLPDTTYTLSGWVNVTSYTGPSASGRGLHASDGISLNFATTLGAATSGWVRHVVTFTTQPSWAVATSQIRLNCVQGTTYWDDIQLEQKSYATPYGTTGAANASPSVRNVPSVQGQTTLESLSRVGGIYPVDGSWALLAGYQPYDNQPNSTGVTTTPITVSTNTTYTFSIYWETETSGPINIRAVDAATNAVLGTFSTPSQSPAGLIRSAVTFATGSTTSVRLQIVNQTSIMGTYTGGSFGPYVYLDAAQLEAKFYATSYNNPGTGPNATSVRTSNVLQYLNQSLTGPLTVICRLKRISGGPAPGTGLAVIGLIGGACSPLLDFGPTVIQVTDNISTLSSRSVTTVVGDVIDVAFTLGADGKTIQLFTSVNGEAMVTSASAVGTVAMGTATTLTVGNWLGSLQANCAIENIMVYGFIVNSTNLQSIFNGTLKPSTTVNGTGVFAGNINDLQQNSYTLTDVPQRLTHWRPAVINEDETDVIFWGNGTIDKAQLEHSKNYPTSYINGGTGTGYGRESTVNLVTNPSFETNVTGWGANGCTFARVNTTPAFDGSWVLEVTTTANNNAGAFTSIPVTALSTYALSAYVKYTSISGTPTVRIRAEFKDAANASLATQVGPTVQLTSTYNRLSLIAVAPATATQMFLTVYTVTNTIGDKYVIDAAQAENRGYVIPYGAAGVAGASTSYRNPNEMRIPIKPVTGDHTIIGWVSPTTDMVAQPQFEVAIGTMNAAGSQKNLRIENTTTGFCAFGAVNNGGSGILTSLFPAVAGDDFFLGLTYSASATQLWCYGSKNGGAVASSQQTGNTITPVTSGLIHLGSTNYLDSTVENVMVFNRVFTATEMANIASGSTTIASMLNDSSFCGGAFINGGFAGGQESVNGLTPVETRFNQPLFIEQPDLYIDIDGDPTAPVYLDSVIVDKAPTFASYFDGSSSDGVWEASNNQTTNPEAATNTTGWTSNASSTSFTITRDTGLASPWPVDNSATPPIASVTKAIGITMASSSNTFSSIDVGYGTRIQSGETWTLSFYAYSVSGHTDWVSILCATNLSNQISPNFNFKLTSNWQRYSFTFTATATAGATDVIYFAPQNHSTFITTGASWRITGVQLEKRDHLTPYNQSATVAESTSIKSAPVFLDYSGQGYDLINQGAVISAPIIEGNSLLTTGTTWIAGPYMNSFGLAGQEQRAFSMEFFVRAKAIPTSINYLAIRDAETIGVSVWPYGYRFTINGQTASPHHAMFPVKNWNEPHHVVACYGNGHMWLVVNGVQGPSTAVNDAFVGTPGVGAAFHIGGYGVTGEPIYLSNIAIYNKILPYDRILARQSW